MKRNRRSNRRHAGLSLLKRALMACLILWLTYGAVPAAFAIKVASEPNKQKPVFQWIFSIVMVGLVCAVAFKNPKRSHQS